MHVYSYYSIKFLTKSVQTSNHFKKNVGLSAQNPLQTFFRWWKETLSFEIVLIHAQNKEPKFVA